MKKNVGTADRIIRLLLAAIMIALYFTNVITGITGIVLVVLGIVFVLTSLASFCPIYSIFGMSTCAVKDKKG